MFRSSRSASRRPCLDACWLLVACFTLWTASLVSAAGPPERVRLLIGFHQPPGQAEVAAIAAQGGQVTRRFRIVPAVAATVPAQAVPALLNDPRVKTVELDAEVQAHEYGTSSGQDWGVTRIGSKPVHDGTVATDVAPVLGSGVRVAVLDTGIDYSHPELAGVYVGGYDFVNNDADPMDDQYHGTHCAGTIAAALNGSGVVGVAPAVHLYGLKVLAANGSGSFSYVISALDWCVQNDIQVASLSLGSSGDPGSTVRNAFDAAEAAGVVIVSSAGNAGSGANTVGYPAQYASVIAVASTTTSDARSSFSSTGPAVEIAAPGSSILSTYPGNRYATLSGTSMACPHVSGVAALIIAAGISDGNGDGRINDDVRLTLQLTADDLGAAGRDNEFGFGLVDADGAVALVYDPTSGGGGGGGGDPAPVFNPPSNLTGAAVDLTVSLQWNDNSNVEEGFEIQYGTKFRGSVNWNNNTLAVDADTTSTSFDLPANTYRIRVRAFKDGGASTTPWSNEIQVSTSSTSGGGGGGKGGGAKGKGGGK